MHPEAEGIAPPPGAAIFGTSRVAPDYFAVFEIPLLAGRTFEASDGANTLVVNDLYRAILIGNTRVSVVNWRGAAKLDRARRDLGYQPHVSTDEGMRRLGAWLKAGGADSARVQ